MPESGFKWSIVCLFQGAATPVYDIEWLSLLEHVSVSSSGVLGHHTMYEQPEAMWVGGI